MSLHHDDVRYSWNVPQHCFMIPDESSLNYGTTCKESSLKNLPKHHHPINSMCIFFS